MKVVLLKDVAGVGRRNEVKNVSDGYALNLLIPKKLAIIGSPSSIAHAERIQYEAEAERKIQEDLLFKNLSSMEGVRVEILGKSNEQGHLFASIHGETIVSELRRQRGIALLPGFLELDKPIKEVGEHRISVRIKGKTGGFTLVVKPA